MIQENMELRRAAILVASLDRQTADSLLDALPSAKATEVRQAIMSLAEIDPAEQQSVIHEFLAGERIREDMALQAETSPPACDEAVAVDSPALVDQPPEQVPLHECNVARLSRLLRHEQPLTIAACLSRLTPTQAVAVVQNLPRDVRGAVLKRTAELQAADPEALAEIESELNQLLQQDIEHQTKTSDGIARLQAMFHHLDSSDRQVLVDDLSQHDRQLATRLNQLAGPGVLRSSSQSATRQTTLPHTASTPSLGLEFHDIRLANDATLGKIFQRCDFETAVLALAGATEQMADELLGRLPVGIARRLRRRLADPGPIRLRDITVAQTSLIELAEQLHLQGVVRMTFPDHRFVASA